MFFPLLTSERMAFALLILFCIYVVWLFLLKVSYFKVRVTKVILIVFLEIDSTPFNTISQVKTVEYCDNIPRGK